MVVVAAQGRKRSDYHLPEPWSGRIEEAPILFVGSNPSFNPNEGFPTAAWRDAEIERFFTTRFEHSNQASHYWRTVRNIATDLLGRTATAGIDYALTEIVRCKSVQEHGVVEAMDACSSRYLMPTLEVAFAPVIVALGKKARVGMAATTQMSSTIGLRGPVSLAGRERWVLMLGHPSAGQRKKPLPEEITTIGPVLGRRGT